MRIELFSIQRCGFYRRRNFCFGDLRSTSYYLQQWIENRQNVADTATYSDPTRVPDQVLCSSCFQIQGNDLGLAFWNKSPSTEHGVAYISLNARPGDLEVAEQQLPRNTIPGWPRYFWIDLTRNIIVALIPEGKIYSQSSGLPDAKRYVHAYLHSYSPYAVWQELQTNQTNQENLVVGWRQYNQDQPDPNLSPKFETKSLILPGPLNEIRQRRRDIKKFVTSSKIIRNVPDVRNRLERAMQALGWDNFRPPEQDKLNFKIETDWTPSEEELENVIYQWTQRQHDLNERVGVRISGEQSTFWFDSAKCRDQIDLDHHLEHSLHWRPEEFNQVIETVAPRILHLFNLAENNYA